MDKFNVLIVNKFMLTISNLKAGIGDKQILTGVSGQCELGKHREHRVLLRRLFHQIDDLICVEFRVGHAHFGNRNRGADEIVRIEVEEGHDRWRLLNDGSRDCA